MHKEVQDIIRYIRLKICVDTSDYFRKHVKFMHPIGVVFYPKQCGNNVEGLHK